MGRNSKLKADRRFARQNNVISETVKEPQKYVPRGVNDLFEGEAAKAAVAALSEEDREKYRIIGDHLYNRVDFESGKISSFLNQQLMRQLCM